MIKKGFTLSEVLIILGIIGVVAAMTIPTLYAKIEKTQNVNRLKKVYAELSQAFRSASMENDIAALGDNWDDTSKVVEALSPHIKIAKIYEPKTSYNNMCYDKNEKHKKLAYSGFQYNWITDKSNGRITFPFTDKTWSIELLNGACVGFAKVSSPYGSQVKNLVFVDIDGSGNGPNVAGKDLYFFGIYKENDFLPADYDVTIEEIKSTDTQYRRCPDKQSNFSLGFSCAARIMREGWEINYY